MDRERTGLFFFPQGNSKESKTTWQGSTITCEPAGIFCVRAILDKQAKCNLQSYASGYHHFVFPALQYHWLEPGTLLYHADA